MRIAFAVNDVSTEEAGYTTTRLATTAHNRGHGVFLIGMGDFAYDSDEVVRARAWRAPKERYPSNEAYLADVQGAKGVRDARISS